MANKSVKLTYPLQMVDEPVLYQLARQFDLITNVRKADVNAHGGWLELDLRGDESVIDAALEWVRSQGIAVEDIQR